MPNVTLIVSPDELRKKLQDREAAGHALIDFVKSATNNEKVKQKFFEWDDFNITLLEASFQSSGWMTSAPVNEYRGSSVGTMTLRMKRAEPGLTDADVEAVLTEINVKCSVLRSISNRTDVFAKAESVKEPTLGSDTQGEAIFIVHGHAHVLRERVRRFLEKVTDREVIVLEDMPNAGNDILGKLLQNADQAGYAVVLLTGDDEGRKAGDGVWQLRARQNVVLELGLFLGKLGRSRVAAIYQSGVELPSDFHGVVYIDGDDSGWTMKLATELKAAGIKVDLNEAI